MLVVVASFQSTSKFFLASQDDNLSPTSVQLVAHAVRRHSFLKALDVSCNGAQKGADEVGSALFSLVQVWQLFVLTSSIPSSLHACVYVCFGVCWCARMNACMHVHVRVYVCTSESEYFFFCLVVTERERVCVCLCLWQASIGKWKERRQITKVHRKSKARKPGSRQWADQGSMAGCVCKQHDWRGIHGSKAQAQQEETEQKGGLTRLEPV